MGVNDFLAFIDLLVLAIFLFSVFRLLKRDIEKANKSVALRDEVMRLLIVRLKEEDLK
ncbi:MAG: hypothetical protein HFF04_08895 [Oscillospiraceae bacterium]|nr:hypothetical protein [Oscillospiraceae bacterium]